ncbi:MAG: ATP-dependent Clp protease adapter ClpS [Bacteriovoracaceae bacterium]|nr:ATP-dependent Clp protease adapter ClpS [Bacteriovoracaceae bacterium]
MTKIKTKFEVDEFIFDPILSEDGDDEGESGVATISRTKVKRPKQFKVLLHNDDYTTMEFVVYVLQRFFGKNADQAQAVMLKVHMEGVGICGVYTHEIAETKVSQVSKSAKENGHPLMCTMEPAD